MRTHIVLDSGPLGLLFQRPGVEPAEACRAWARGHLAAGTKLVVPEIVHYEIRRELLRLRKSKALKTVESFVHAEPDRFWRLTSEDLLLAADLWAQTRQRGTPTADVHALDIDMILCAQVLNSGVPAADLMVATTNPKHLVSFVPAMQWNAITQGA